MGAATERHQHVVPVGLMRIVKGGLITARLTTRLAHMHDDPTFLWMLLNRHWFKRTAAFARAVTRVNIHMQRPETLGAMVANRAVGEGCHRCAAGHAVECFVGALDGEAPHVRTLARSVALSLELFNLGDVGVWVGFAFQAGSVHVTDFAEHHPFGPRAVVKTEAPSDTGIAVWVTAV